MNISIEEMPREIARLEQENERLQEELDKTRLSELDKEYRLDKAIEYIEKQAHRNQQFYEMDKDNLLDILKGSE